MNAQKLGSLLVLIGGVVAFSSALAQFANSGKIRGFVLPEFFEQAPGQTNRMLKTRITGSEAQPNVSSGIWAVKDMKIETFEESGTTNIIALSPQCQVDLSRRLVWSTGRLEITTADRRLFTEGNEGFFCQMTNAMLILSNNVRTVISRELVRQRTHENKTN